MFRFLRYLVSPVASVWERLPVTDRGIAWTTHWLVRARWVLLAIAVLLSLLSQWVPRDIEFDRSVQNLISSKSDVLTPFRRLKRTFGGNEIVLAVYQDPDLLNPDGTGIDRLRETSDRLAAIQGVRSTLSLDKLMGGAITSNDGVAARLRQLFEGYTHNADGNVAVVVCMLQPESGATPPRRATIDALRNAIQDLPEPLQPGMITGEPVMLVDGFRFVERDGRRLSLWSSLLMGLTILICFRSLRWMLICIGVVQLALILTHMGVLLLGLRMSMVSSMLTAVVTVVGVATVVHIIVRFQEAEHQGDGPIRALVRTIRILWIPVFLACATDAVGFASLMAASVGPVRDFGLMMAISCFGVLVSVWLLVPALSTLGGSRRRQQPQPDVASQMLRDGLRRFAFWAAERPWQLSIVSFLFIASSMWGLRFLEVETDFTRNFRRGSEIVQAYRFVEDRLGGAGVGDILIPAPERLTWDYLRLVRRMELEIEQESQRPGPLQGLTKVLSLADAVVAGAPHLDLQTPSNLRSEITARAGLLLMRKRIPSFYRALHAVDPEQQVFYLRIMFRAREQQDARSKRALIERLQQIADKHFGPQREPLDTFEPNQSIPPLVAGVSSLQTTNEESNSVTNGQSRDSGANTTQRTKESHRDSPLARPEVTGFYVLLAYLIDSIVSDQGITFMVAIVAIGLTMLVAFRQLFLAIVTLLPNILPVLVVSGVMGWIHWWGWYEFRINMGSAMIAAVSLGLSIDSSIHYVFAYREGRRQGLSVDDAIAAAHGTVGLSMIFATLALIVGFSILATSNFTPTVYFGSLVSLSMLGGLVGNLLVLPICLRYSP